MDMCACVIGNSSSAIREGAIVGTPAVNIGTRQMGRCRGRNVIDVDYEREMIEEAIHQQLKNDKYDPDFIYGNGGAGKKITKTLMEIDLNKVNIQKRFIDKYSIEGNKNERYKSNFINK